MATVSGLPTIVGRVRRQIDFLGIDQTLEQSAAGHRQIEKLHAALCDPNDLFAQMS